MAFIIPVVAAVACCAVWQSPQMLNLVIAKLSARRDALLVYRKSYRWHVSRLEVESQ